MTERRAARFNRLVERLIAMRRQSGLVPRVLMTVRFAHVDARRMAKGHWGIRGRLSHRPIVMARRNGR